MLIGLVSCTKAKTPHAAPARELYSPSALFRGALRALEGRADVVYVLSARYGLLPLDQEVEPYDQTLKDATPRERRAWAEGVLAGLQARYGRSLSGVTFEFHCGEAYRAPLEELLKAAGAACTCPVDGLPMGQRLAFYAGAVVAPLVPALQLALAGLQGRRLTTGTGAPFLVAEVGKDRVVVVPESTKKPRPVTWAELDGAWACLRERGTLTLAEVREAASEANPAYVFAILGEVAGVRLELGRPMRLRLAR